MARRTKTYTKIPWTGGINTSVDPGMLNDNDVITADNVVFASSGSRLKRQGFEYIDSAVPTPTHSESSGTTRTLYFEAGDEIIDTTPTDDYKLVLGEKITVTGDDNFVITGAKITSITATSLTYEVPSSYTQAKTATSLIEVKRSSTYINVLDYWYTDASGNKQQLLLAASDQFKLFKFDSVGRRTEISGQEQVTSVTTVAASSLTTGDYWLINSANDVTEYYVWYNIDAAGGNPAPTGKTGVEVAIASTDTADQVAAATRLALDALNDFSASVSTNVVTVTNATAGTATDASDVNTTFTIATTTTGATLPTTSPSQITSIVFNGRAVFSFDAKGDKTIKYRPDDSAKYQLLGGSPPDANFMYEYQGRLWANDKSDDSRVHYSSPGNHEEWLGIGDSGALDIAPGDGDARGIVAVFAYKGSLQIQKGSKSHRVLGTTPENYRVELVTKGLGSESHTASVAVDQSDVAFMSSRGFHSMQATDTYGDTESAFLSAKIQPTFNEWNVGRLKYAQGAYLPTINSIAWVISEDGFNEHNAVWLFNTITSEWYRWPNVYAGCVTTRLFNSETKLLFGGRNSRIIQAQRSAFRDFADTPTVFRIKTGTIYPDGNPNTVKAFKKLGFVFRPKGDYQFTVKAKIDNFPAQSLVFQQTSGGAVLGTDFVLGESILGVDNVLAPFTQQIDGYGRGITLEITQSGTDEQVEIYGFIIEFEDADLEQETKEG